MHPVRATLTATTLCLLAAGTTTAQDLGDCPMTEVVFRDATGAQSFNATHVAFQLDYLCDDEMVPATEIGPRHACRGPFGSYVLLGNYWDQNTQSDLYVMARFHVLPASPCCGWDVSDISGINPIPDGLLRVPEVFVPRLADWPSDAIGSPDGGAIPFGSNPDYSIRLEPAECLTR